MQDHPETEPAKAMDAHAQSRVEQARREDEAGHEPAAAPTESPLTVKGVPPGGEAPSPMPDPLPAGPPESPEVLKARRQASLDGLADLAVAVDDGVQADRRDEAGKPGG